MEENPHLTSLRHMVNGLVYYSEYEYPVSFFDVNAPTEEAIPPLLASYKNTDIGFVKNIGPDVFFARFQNYLSYGGPDMLLNNNARRFVQLQQFLQQHFEKILVYRIQKPGEALIPVFIIARDWQGGFTGLETLAMET